MTVLTNFLDKKHEIAFISIHDRFYTKVKKKTQFKVSVFFTQAKLKHFLYLTLISKMISFLLTILVKNLVDSRYVYNFLYH